jgi:2-polyprenyl-3-methyl-5-hydroxy-6-metoxy-1,4-benzoquinol methylase
MLIERKNCPICISNKFKILFSLPYHDSQIQQFFKNYYQESINLYLEELKRYDYVIQECLNCSLIFQKYIPSDKFSKTLYEEIINEKESKIKKEKLSTVGYFKDFELFKKIFKKENSDISIIEFGSGNGDWAYEAKKLNFDITVTEHSKNRIEVLKKKGLKICININECNDKFDIIYSNQVFEHISNPAETLKLLKPLLKKDGYIYLKFPSAFMFKNKLKMNYQPKKDCAIPLEHINILNRKTFLFLIKDLNLEISYFNRHSIFTYKKYLKFLKDFFYFDQILIKNKKSINK